MESSVLSGSCPFCGNKKTQYKTHGPIDGLYSYSCPNCGEFQLKGLFRDFGINDVDKSELPRISGYIREMNEMGRPSVYIDDDNVNEILNSALIARTVDEKLNKLLLYIYLKTSSFGDFVTRPDYDMPAICYANNFQEFNELINVLSDNGFIEYGGDYYKIKYDGILRAEQLKKEISMSNSAFVAMWFDPSMDEVYAKAINGLSTVSRTDFIRYGIS